jgi:hypothetical protein
LNNHSIASVESSSSSPSASSARETEFFNRASSLRARLRGGPDGNEQLTAATGVVLVILLAALGLTILRIGQLIWLHMFLGLLLIGPVLLKMGSTGYRFALYYLREPTYVRKGPPETWLRLIAPIIVFTTVGVFVTGVWLLFIGPVHREPLAQIHKIFFIVWVVFTAFHVLGHLPGMPEQLRGARTLGLGSGQTGRAIVLAGVLVGGLVLALVLIPEFATWTSNPSAWHHHHHDG